MESLSERRVPMRTVLVVAVSALFAAVSAGPPALAQRLPRKSSSEQQVDTINRSLRSQQRQLGQQQQNQFEVNQLRNDFSRQQNAPSMMGPNAIRPCSPGAVRC
jgi:hypothetical protein